MYQDEIAQNPEMRAVYIANKRLGAGSLQVVDRLSDGLWLGSLVDPTPAFAGTGATVRAAPSDSLFVPFRESIRSAFPYFVRVTGGPGPVSEYPQPGRVNPDHLPYTDHNGWMI